MSRADGRQQRGAGWADGVRQCCSWPTTSSPRQLDKHPARPACAATLGRQPANRPPGTARQGSSSSSSPPLRASQSRWAGTQTPCTAGRRCTSRPGPVGTAVSRAPQVHVVACGAARRAQRQSQKASRGHSVAPPVGSTPPKKSSTPAQLSRAHPAASPPRGPVAGTSAAAGCPRTCSPAQPASQCPAAQSSQGWRAAQCSRACLQERGGRGAWSAQPCKRQPAWQGWVESHKQGTRRRTRTAPKPRSNDCGGGRLPEHPPEM